LVGPKRTIWDHYDNELVDITKTSVSEHHDLIPYTRSFLYQATQTGMPVMRALIFAYPHDGSPSDTWDEYLYVTVSWSRRLPQRKRKAEMSICRPGAG
jgi:alpha-glucosidase (family GH31 glycosyl hydrolase)